MNTAVIAVTSRGARLGLKVAGALKKHGHAAQVYSIPDVAGETEGVLPLEGSLGQVMGNFFSSCRWIVMIMALGIVVRAVAPHVRDKKTDPAVVAMDERGNFAISVLSGHVGGANDLARLLEGEMGCTAVITTATDCGGVPALDVIARDFKMAPEPPGLLKKFNSALARGERVHVYTMYHLPVPDWDLMPVKPWKMAPGGGNGLKALVTGQASVDAPGVDLLLRPQNLVVGVGCKKGAGAQDILWEIKISLEDAGRSPLCVRALATITDKINEYGLVDASLQLGVPLLGFGPAELNIAIEKYGLSKSDFVMKKMGVGGVCEPAAMLACRNGKLLAPKRKAGGITVAVAEESSRWWELGPDQPTC